MTLTDFLLARITEDEACVRAGDVLPTWRSRLLAECESKRETIRLAVDYLVPYTGDTEESLLRHLALPYADHPDWREEWRP